MKIMYIVSYCRHIINGDEWDYKMVGRYDNLTQAKKTFHSKMASDMGSETFDLVTVVIYDSYGNMITSESWQKTIEPVIDEKQIAIDNAIAEYKVNPTDENLAKIKEAVTAE